MTEKVKCEIIESPWLNWCRLCAKEDVRGNVKVYTGNNANWNSGLVMAITKYFNVQLHLEDVLCKECYTLLSELIDFAEHVNKVQAIFETLRCSEPNENLDIEDLRVQYGLREEDWTHIIKPVLEFEHSEAKPTELIIDMHVDYESDGELNQLEHPEDSDSYERPVQAETECSTMVIEPEFHSDYSEESDDSDIPKKRTKLECKWCAKVYRNPASYQKHLRLLGCRKTPYCKLCNKTLPTAAALKQHQEEIHANKLFVCDHCGKQAKTSTALKDHKLVHTEERPFVCDICQAGFKNNARLKIHMQIHEEPSYVCNICGMKLQTRRTWNMHKLVHSDDRKFKCDVCNVHFKRSKTLKRHLLSHSGLRPYVCDYCDKTFASNSNCRTHKLKKHPNELKNEQNCQITPRFKIPTLDELRVM